MRRCLTRVHAVARPCRAVGGLPWPHAWRRGCAESAPPGLSPSPWHRRVSPAWPASGVARGGGLGVAVPPWPCLVTVSPAGASAGQRGIPQVVCSPAIPSAMSGPGVRSQQGIASGRGQSRGADAGGSRGHAAGGVAPCLVRQSLACVSSLRRGRRQCADRLPPAQGVGPSLQPSHPTKRVSRVRRGRGGTCARGCPAGGGATGPDRADRESGAQRGRTRACRRLEIASAHASLRLFPAPDA